MHALYIYSPQGRLVWWDEDYHNDFSGRDQDNRELEQGVYYFTLVLNAEKGTVYRGDINIIRN
jgi:hypothetical protein